jgi:hypothetical protein
VDCLSKREETQATELEFFVRRDEETFSRITVSLDRNGSLAPLFLSFGLLTPSQVEYYDLQTSNSNDDPFGLIDWLQQVISDASDASRQYEELKNANTAIRDQLEEKFGIQAIDLGGTNYLTSNLQLRHKECLENLKIVLEKFPNGKPGVLFGLKVRLYHPEAIPMVNSGTQESDGTFRIRNTMMESHVASNGTVHLIASIAAIERALVELDLNRARIFNRVETYWMKRSRDLASELSSILGVRNVWYNSLSPRELQDFVLWSGEMLQYCRRSSIANFNEFAFDIMVQSWAEGSSTGNVLDHIPGGRILTVRTDCPPQQLLDFLLSQSGMEAHHASNYSAEEEAMEETALQAACETLGAKKVVRICSSYEKGHVMAATERLIEAAPYIRASLDLSNVSLALDDRYDVWDSGIISIPYDFRMNDIEPKLKALLLADTTSSRRRMPLPPSSAMSVSRRKNSFLQSVTMLRRGSARPSCHKTTRNKPYIQFRSHVKTLSVVHFL